MALKPELLGLAPKKNQLGAAPLFGLENSLSAAYGRDGMRVFLALDGKKTVGQILSETGMPEKKMLAMLSMIAKSGGADIKPGLLEEAEGETGNTAGIALAKAKPGIMPTLRSSAEKKVFEKFGGEGLEAYRLLDTNADPGQIPAKLGISQEKMAELVEFMEAEGLVKLGKPGEGTQKARPKRLDYNFETPKSPEERQAAENAKKRMRPPAVPEKKPLGIVAKIRLEAGLIKKFGAPGKAIYDSIDGSKPTVRLAKESRKGFAAVDAVLDFLASQNAVTLRELTPQEMKEKYGEEGVAICDLYGRDGLLVYDLIDKRATIKDIVRASGLEPRNGVEILAFIHRILGVDIAFDSNAILASLEAEKMQQAKKAGPAA